MPEFVSGFLPAFFRWMHIFAGVLWIGLLYFFNFVNGPFAATMDGDSKKKVVPELMPRALFWFRWGAFWTYVTGILMLLLTFYHGRLMSDDGSGWTLGMIVMVLVNLVAAPFIYDALAKSGLAKNKKVYGIVAFVLVTGIAALMVKWGNFGYRAYNIHISAMFGTIMAFNVWYRIWPAQQKIISAVKNGEAPNPDLVAMAGGRSRQNVYMSVPLFWGMMNQHSTYFSGGNLGLTSDCAWIVFPVAIALGWHIVWHCYNKAGKVKGF